VATPVLVANTTTDSTSRTSQNPVRTAPSRLVVGDSGAVLIRVLPRSDSWRGRRSRRGLPEFRGTGQPGQGEHRPVRALAVERALDEVGVAAAGQRRRVDCLVLAEGALAVQLVDGQRHVAALLAHDQHALALD